ncbi:MAG: HAD-IIIA family hydrolase [Candidatus Omnitrophota bacterium]
MANRKKVIFLDRDGVINKFPGKYKYITTWKLFKFIPGSIEAIKRLTHAGFILFVISNQAGVTKRLYSKATLNLISKKMLERIKKAGGKIKKVLYCIHLDEDGCDCRKPKIGMIRRALVTLGSRVDRKNSYVIGDNSQHDIKMGKRAKFKTILVLSGREKLADAKVASQRPDYIFKNLLEAANFILKANV